MDKRNLLLIFYITFSVISFYHFQIVKNLYEINKVCLHVIKSTIFFEFQRPSTAATTFGSRIIHKDRKMDLDSDSEDENAEREALADLNDLKAIRKEEDFKPVEGMPGMYYKVRLRYNCVQFTGIIKIYNQLFPLIRNQHVSSPSVFLCWNVYYLSLIVCELFAILMVERNSLVIYYQVTVVIGSC